MKHKPDSPSGNVAGGKSRSYLLAAIMAVVAFVSFVHILVFLKSGMNVYDEGVAMFGAARVAGGDVPYRDFWTMYAPAQFYVLAGLFKVFGFSLIVERIFSAVLLLLISVLTSHIVWRICGRWYALLTLMLSLVWVSSFEGRGTAVVPAIMLVMFSCLPMVKFLRTRRRLYAFCAGIFVGVAVLFRHDLGILAIIAQAGVLLLSCCRGMGGRSQDGMGVDPQIAQMGIDGKGRGRERGDSSADYADGDGWGGGSGEWRAALFSVCLYFVGVGVVVFPVLILLLLTVPLSVLADCLLVFPFKVYPVLRSLPYPILGVQALVFYFVPGICLLSAIKLVCDLFRRSFMLDERDLRTLLFIALSVFFMGGAIVRPDVTHLFPAMFPAVVLLMFFLRTSACFQSYSPTTQGRGGLGMLLYVAVVGVTVLTFLRPLTFQITNLLSLRHGYGGVVMRAERASGIRIEKSRSSYDEMIRYIQDNVPQNSSIFIGNWRHDRISINDVMLYFLCDRNCLTKYHELHPGLATTFECQKEIVDEIKEAGMAMVVLGNFDGAECLDDGSVFLDEFLRNNYVCVTNFGNYAVLRLNNTLPEKGQRRFLPTNTH